MANDALARGFAVISSDSGHGGSDPANASAGLIGGNHFGQDHKPGATKATLPTARSVRSPRR